MADDIRSPVDTSKKNYRSADWYEPGVQMGWTAQSRVHYPELVTSEKMYGHPLWDEETQQVIPVEPYTALYYDDPNDIQPR